MPLIHPVTVATADAALCEVAHACTCDRPSRGPLDLAVIQAAAFVPHAHQMLQLL